MIKSFSIICLSLIALVLLTGCVNEKFEQRTITIADKDPTDYYILGTDGNQYYISDFVSAAIAANNIREKDGLNRINYQFYWNLIKINNTYKCDFGTAMSGAYILSNCTKVE